MLSTNWSCDVWLSSSVCFSSSYFDELLLLEVSDCCEFFVIVGVDISG